METLLTRYDVEWKIEGKSTVLSTDIDTAVGYIEGQLDFMLVTRNPVRTSATVKIVDARESRSKSE